jgi:hypothetical protein
VSPAGGTGPVVASPVAEQPSIPDPRIAVSETVRVAKRLEDVFEGVTRRFAQAPATLEAEITELEETAAVERLDYRHLGVRAGAAVEHLDNLRAALGAADGQHDRNIRLLADHRAGVARLAGATVVRDALVVGAMTARATELVVADADLRALAGRATALVPSISAAVARHVHAAGIVSRRVFVAGITRQLHQARLIVNVAQSHRQTQAGHEEYLLGLVQQMRTRSGEPLPLPEVVWPSGKNADPFAGPVLKDV